MARRTIEITIEDRGNPLHFVIEEMPATKLESWIIRALLLVAGAGIQVPDGADLRKAGAFLAERGVSALGTLDYDKAKPLLDELLGCCYRRLDNARQRCTPETLDGFVEDVQTIFRLRVEAIKLNLGFLQAEAEKLSSFRVSGSTKTL